MVVIILGLTAVSLLVINVASKRSDDVLCSNNLRDLWSAAQEYSNDWNGRLPANGMYDDGDTPEDESRGWMVPLARYLYGPSDLKLPNIDDKFRCPSDINVNRRYGKGEFVPALAENVSYVPWTDGSDNPDNPQSQINMARGYNQVSVPWLSEGVEIPETRNVATPADYDKYVLPALERHGDKINVLYVGGSVRMVEAPSFEKVFPNGLTKSHLNN